jgi:hypothetical protein
MKIWNPALLFISFLSAQETFQFTMKFTDSRNHSDSIVLGYAPRASIYLDDAFSEKDISDVPIDTVIDVRVLVPGTGPNEYRKFQSKTQITSIGDCGANSPINTIAIFTKHWPVTASWEPGLFSGPCSEGSVFASSVTDVASPSGFHEIEFRDAANLVFSRQTQNSASNQIFIVANDTANVYWQAFNTHAFDGGRVGILPFEQPTRKSNPMDFRSGRAIFRWYLINGARRQVQ